MKLPLPIPFKKYIPKLFHSDSKSDSLANKAEEHILEWFKDAMDIQRIYRPDETKSIILPYLNNYLFAGISTGDDETTRRKKIRDAIPTHQIRTLWDDQVKGGIEAITGTTPLLYGVSIADSDDWIELGNLSTDPVTYWGTEGIDDGTDTKLGKLELGLGLEVEIAGNIYIDLVDSGLTPTEIQSVRDYLEDDKDPAYYIIHLGYVSGGVWTDYPNGIIQ
jgi:hypothetical protein